jgi:peptidoglycan-N-acetylglucosamine deacetylase
MTKASHPRKKDRARKLNEGYICDAPMVVMMWYASFTVDVDRDVNLPQWGRASGISRERAGSSSPRFDSCARGLEIIVDLLDEMGIRGTFFLEARAAQVMARSLDLADLLKQHEIASHGFEHEDLTGEKTGIPISKDDVYFILERSRDELENLLGRRPMGFRAPYLQAGEDILDSVAETGFSYDSSITGSVGEGVMAPWRLPNSLIEVPLTVGIDDDGRKIYSYLWAMHEGRRPPEDYLGLMRQNRSGLTVLATHSWHLVETFSEGLLDRERENAARQNLRAVLEGAMDMGVHFIGIEEYLARFFEG